MGVDMGHCFLLWLEEFARRITYNARTFPLAAAAVQPFPVRPLSPLLLAAHLRANLDSGLVEVKQTRRGVGAHKKT